MSDYALQCIIGTALVDHSFRAKLLEDPRAALAGFDLTAAERRLAGSIRARSLEEYAGRLEQHLTGAESTGRPWAASRRPSRSRLLVAAS